MFNSTVHVGVCKQIQEWFPCVFWAQSREKREKWCSVLFIQIKQHVSLKPAFIHKFKLRLDIHAIRVKLQFWRKKKKITTTTRSPWKQTWWPSASWTFPKINEFISWEAGTGNRCSQRNAGSTFFLLQCAHMKHVSLFKTNTLLFLSISSQCEVKLKIIQLIDNT